MITPHHNQGRAFKYQFDIQIHKVKMHIPIRCYVQLSWRRGNKSIQTKNKIEIHGNQTQFQINQKLSMISTCFFDEVNRKFTQKNSAINLILYINNVPKAGGSCPIDLSQILNPLNYKQCYSKTIDASLIKCPISLAGKISFSLSGTYLQQMMCDDRSTGSGVSGISALMNCSESNYSYYRKNDTPSRQFQVVQNRNSSKKSDEGFRESKRKIECVSNLNNKQNQNVGINVISQNNQNDSNEKLAAITKKKLSERMDKIQQNVYQIKNPFKDKISLKQMKDEKLREEKFRLQNQNTQLKVFTDEQTKKMNEFIKQNMNLKQQIKGVVMQKQSMIGQINRLRQQNSRLNLNINRLQKEKNQIQRKNEVNFEYQQKINDLQSLIGKQMKEIQVKIIQKDKFESLKMQYENMKNRYEKCEIQKNRLMEYYEKQGDRKMNELNNIFKQKMYEKQNFIESIKREFEKIYNQKQQLIKIRNELNGKLNELNQIINKQNEQKQKIIQNYEQKLKINSNQYKILQKALLNNNQKIKHKQKQIIQKQQLYKIKFIQYQQTIRKFTQIQTDNHDKDKLTNIINTKNNQINNLQALLNQYQYQINILNKHLDQSKLIQDKYIYQNKSLFNQIHQKQNQSNLLNTQIINLKHQSSSKINKLNTQLQNLKKTFNQKNHSFIQTNNLFISQKNKNQQIYYQIQHLSSIYNQTKIQHQTLQQKFHQLSNHQNHTQNKLVQYQNIINKQTQQLNLLNQIIQKNQQVKINQQQFKIKMDQLIKQNLQLQIQLKVKTDYLDTNTCNNQDILNLKNKLQIEQQNMRQYEEQIQKLQKQVKDKHRALLIQCQKSKMYGQQRGYIIQQLNEKQIKYELQKQKVEVLQKNMKQLQQRLEQSIKKCRQNQNSIRLLNSELIKKQQKSQDMKILEKRNKQLQSRQSQKILILEELNKNLYKSNQVIKQLHKTIQTKNKQILNRQKYINQLQNKLHHNQDLKKKSIQILSILNQKKNLQKKNQLLFNQICTLRQKCNQHTKNSLTLVNNQQLNQKIQSLQNQLNKRQQKIKKLERQNNKLEQQNIQLNIKIMKQLTQIQKKQQGIKIEYSKSLNKVLSDSQI